MNKVIELTEAEFEGKYTPQINHIERANTDSSIDDEDLCSFNGCMFETYGEELDYVREMAKENRVVTIIEGEDELGEDGEEHSVMYYSSGYHHVNRIGYLVVDKPLEEDFNIKID